MRYAAEILKISANPVFTFEIKTSQTQGLINEALNTFMLKLDFLENAVREFVEKWV